MQGYKQMIGVVQMKGDRLSTSEAIIKVIRSLADRLDPEANLELLLKVHEGKVSLVELTTKYKT